MFDKVSYHVKFRYIQFSQVMLCPCVVTLFSSQVHVVLFLKSCIASVLHFLDVILDVIVELHEQLDDLTQ